MTCHFWQATLKVYPAKSLLHFPSPRLPYPDYEQPIITDISATETRGCIEGHNRQVGTKTVLHSQRLSKLYFIPEKVQNEQVGTG